MTIRYLGISRNFTLIRNHHNNSLRYFISPYLFQQTLSFSTGNHINKDFDNIAIRRRDTSGPEYNKHENGEKLHRSESDDALLAEIADDLKTGKDQILKPSEIRQEYYQEVKRTRKRLKDELNDDIAKNFHIIKNYNVTKASTPIDRIDMTKLNDDSTFNDVVDNPVLAEAFKNCLGNNKPTDFQKRLLTLSTSWLSSLAKGDSGTGKTLALIISAFVHKRNPRRGASIPNLIIVKSNLIALKYQKIITEIQQELDRITEKETNINDVAQFLYRADKETEQQQQDILADHPIPFILVATPQRLLDLLSTRGMGYLKIQGLGLIQVDDFDTMLDPIFYLDTKRKEPVVALLDYVLKLQDYRRKHNEPHPQVIITVGSTVDESLIEQLKETTKWINWNRFVELGTFEGSSQLPVTKYVSENVGISSILAVPSINNENPVDNDNDKNKNKNIEVDLFDMVPFEYGNSVRDWMTKLYRISKGDDLYYQKHRNIKRMMMNRKSKELKEIELEVLVSGFVKLVTEGRIRDGRMLVVYPDDASAFKLEKLLRKSGKLSKIFSFEDGDEDFFVRKEEDGKPKFLLINTSSLTGLAFKGLNSTIVLGNDALKNLSSFVTIAGRMRGKSNCLLPEHLFSTFIDAEPNPNKQDDPIIISKKIYLINSQFDFGNLERNFLERMLLKGGLVRQFQTIDVLEPGFDKKDYEDQFQSDYNIELIE